LEPRQVVLRLLVAVEHVVAGPSQTLERLEHAELDVPQRPREHPVGAGLLQLLRERPEVGGGRRHDHDRDGLEAHLSRPLGLAVSRSARRTSRGADSVRTGLQDADVAATTMTELVSESFFAAAAARGGSLRSSSDVISTGWPLLPPASFTRLKYALYASYV